MELFKNRKAISPLVATILLIVFSLILGTITMNLGKAYIEGINSPKASAESQDMKYIGSSLYKCAEINQVTQDTQECARWELVK
jgi:flagellin-like protein